MGSFLMKALFASRPDSIWDERTFCAFGIAPVAPVLISSLFYTMSPDLAGIAGILSYAHMLMLALPCAFILNLFRKISVMTVVLLSFLIGAVPITIYHVYAILHPEDGTNPVFTMADMPRTIAFALSFGGFGLSAGVAWWFMALFRKPTPQQTQ